MTTAARTVRVPFYRQTVGDDCSEDRVPFCRETVDDDCSEDSQSSFLQANCR